MSYAYWDLEREILSCQWNGQKMVVGKVIYTL